MCDHHHVSNPSVHQSLDELEFERSLGNAALCGDINKVKEHLRKGANVNTCDAGGYAPLHYAARKGNIEVAKLLLFHGGDIDVRTRAGRVTPLLRAAFSGKEEMCRYLVLKGADVRSVDDDGQTVLHRAVNSRNTSLVKYFLEIAPDLKSIEDKKGHIPLKGDQIQYFLLEK